MGHDTNARGKYLGHINQSEQTGCINLEQVSCYIGQGSSCTDQNVSKMGHEVSNTGQNDYNKGQYGKDVGQYGKNVGQYGKNVGQYGKNVGQNCENVGQDNREVLALKKGSVDVWVKQGGRKRGDEALKSCEFC